MSLRWRLLTSVVAITALIAGIGVWLQRETLRPVGARSVPATPTPTPRRGRSWPGSSRAPTRRSGSASWWPTGDRQRQVRPLPGPLPGRRPVQRGPAAGLFGGAGVARGLAGPLGPLLVLAFGHGARRADRGRGRLLCPAGRGGAAAEITWREVLDLQAIFQLTGQPRLALRLSPANWRQRLRTWQQDRPRPLPHVARPAAPFADWQGPMGGMP